MNKENLKRGQELSEKIEKHLNKVDAVLFT